MYVNVLRGGLETTFIKIHNIGAAMKETNIVR